MKKLRRLRFVLLSLLLAAMLTVVGVRAQDEASALSEEAAMAFAEQFDAIFDGPSLEIADEIFSPDFVAHLPLAPELDREGWKNYAASFYAGFSDLTQEVNEVIVGKDRVVLLVTYTGTHDGPLFGIPATGKSVTMEGIGIFSFDENGLATENWAVLDVVGVLAQIGAFPPGEDEAKRQTLNDIAAEVTNGNFEALSQYIAEDYVLHSPLGDVDRAGLTGLLMALSDALTDFNMVRNQVMVEGDLAATSTTISGVFENEFVGPMGTLPPTGQPFALEIVNIFQFGEKGMIVEEWAQFDNLSFMTQLGAMSGPTEAATTANPLPAPTGPHQVGIVWRHWVDESRDEPYDESSDAKREVIVEILYPAEAAADAETAAYMDNREQVLPAFAALLEAFVALELNTQPDDLDSFLSHAYPNAPISDDQTSYPVLIFSHGGAADARMYTAQLEELASHGYIVAAINHVYGAAVTVLNDGSIAAPTYSTGLEGAAQIWSQDQIFVMDQLEELNTNDPEGLFTNRLDLERLGVFGQSLGGATSTITCFVDARCKAGANGDGPVYGDVIEQGLDQPFLLFLSDSRTNYDPANYAQARGPFYEVAVEGFEHLNFGDFPLWPNVDSLIEAKWLSDADGARSVEITNAALLTFFDQYVKGRDETSMDALNAYPEITVTSRNGETS